jgi:hypothetical protein
LKRQYLAIAVAAMLVGAIRVGIAQDVNAVNQQFPPTDLCYDQLGNTRYVKAGSSCNPNERKMKVLPQWNGDPADDPQAQLQNQVTSLQAKFQQQVADLTAKVAALQTQVNQNADNSGSGLHQMPGQTGASKNNLANASPKIPSSTIGTKVIAPFFVTDSSGNLIMVVDAPAKGTVSGMTIYNPDGSFVQVGPGQSGYSGVRVYDGRTGSTARAFMGMLEDSRPGFALAKKDGSLSSAISSSGDNGEMDFFNSSGKLAAVIGANPENGEGHAKFMDPSGTPLALIGAAGTHGDVLLFGEGKRIPVWEFTLVGVR